MKKEIEKGKSPKKEIPKNTSGFGGKSHLSREKFREWLRRPEQFKITKTPSKERAKLERELFGSEYGHYIEKGEPEKALKKLEIEKYKTSGVKREKIEKKIKLIKKFLGK